MPDRISDELCDGLLTLCSDSSRAIKSRVYIPDTGDKCNSFGAFLSYQMQAQKHLFNQW